MCRALAVLLLLISGILFCLNSAAEDWPQFLGPARNGLYSGAIEANDFQLLWKKGVGQGFRAPVVARGRLILFHRLGGREVVEYLEASSGPRLCIFEYSTGSRDSFGFGEGPRPAPAIVGHRV